jgi:hypothetical protein
MRRRPDFEEVMIVNPAPAGPGEPGERTMRFHYYGQPQDVAGYGYYGEAPQFPGYAGYGYYGQPAEVAGYGHYAQPQEVAGYGYYGQPQEVAGYGYYGQPQEVAGYGYYGEPAEVAGYGYVGQPEPVGYFAEEMPVGYYGDDPNAMSDYQTAGYGEMPEMVGYGDDSFAEEYPGVSDYAEDYSDYSEYGDYSEYAEPGIEGYVREVPSPFNAGCPLPLNTGLAAGDDFAGYSKPGEVSPSCTAFAEQPGSPSMVPDTLRPLW